MEQFIFLQKVIKKSNKFKNYKIMSIILRIRAPSGQFRLSLPEETTYLTLLKKIHEKTQIVPKAMKIYLKQNQTKLVQGRKNNTLKNLRFTNGQILFVEGKIAKKKSNIEIEKPQEFLLTNKCTHGPNGRCMYCLESQIAQSPEKGKAGKVEYDPKMCNHGEKGTCGNCLKFKFTKDPTPKKPQNKKNPSSKLTQLCKHGPNAMCGHCMYSDKIQDVKHVPFDHYLMQNATQNDSEQKHQNFFVHPLTVNYKVKGKCSGSHLPYPEGMCNKCIPPAFTPKRQPYRHVDYVSFYNKEEINNFVNNWSQMEQRMGWLYGWYAEDPNYKGGVRCIVEGIYEPPQIGSFDGYQVLNDKFRKHVDKIAAHLKFERVGIIFTSINNDVALSSQKICEIARLQHDHNIRHPWGFDVSKFVTVVVKPHKVDAAQRELHCYMVSDQAQALQINDIFYHSQDSRKSIKIREAKKGELIPVMLCKNKPDKQCDPDFFIINVAHGVPKSNQFAYIKRSCFPVENRQKAQTVNYFPPCLIFKKKQDLKKYMAVYKKRENFNCFSDFHLLLYLANILDTDTAAVIARAVQEETEVSKNIMSLIESMAKK